MRDVSDPYEFFGSSAQIRLQTRTLHLWPYLKTNPRLSFVGRAIGLDEPALDDAAELSGLAKELGFLALAFTKENIAGELASALEAQGLKVGFWQHLLSNEQTAGNCRSVVSTRYLPTGYRIARITEATPHQQLRSFQELMHDCGVAPLPGYILRGQAVPTIAEMVINAQDEVAATGASIFRHNPAGPYARAAHVGYLATKAAERGQGLAQLLLARLSLASFEYGANLLHTGVRAENEASQRVCGNCGLVNSGMFFLGVVYPPLLEGGTFTR